MTIPSHSTSRTIYRCRRCPTEHEKVDFVGFNLSVIMENDSVFTLQLKQHFCEKCIEDLTNAIAPFLTHGGSNVISTNDAGFTKAVENFFWKKFAYFGNKIKCFWISGENRAPIPRDSLAEHKRAIKYFKTHSSSGDKL